MQTRLLVSGQSPECSNCPLLFGLSKKTEYFCSVWFFYSVSQFSPIEIIVFDMPIEDFDFLTSNVKRYFSSLYVLESSWGVKIAKLAVFWTKLCAL